MPASSIVEYLALIPGDWHPHDFCLIVTKCREFVIVTVEALNLKSNNFFSELKCGNLILQTFMKHDIQVETTIDIH